MCTIISPIQIYVVINYSNNEKRSKANGHLYIFHSNDAWPSSVYVFHAGHA